MGGEKWEVRRACWERYGCRRGKERGEGETGSLKNRAERDDVPGDGDEDRMRGRPGVFATLMLRGTKLRECDGGRTRLPGALA